jgi:hypothetical protein
VSGYERTLADAETVISDWQCSVIEGRLRDQFRVVPDATEFATFIQAPKYVVRGPGDEGWLPSMAVFLVKSPHPTNPKAPGLVTHGTVELAVLEQDRAERRHFVSLKEDPAFLIFSVVLKTHLETLQNLRELIH